MIYLALIPHRAIGPVELGMSRETVRATLAAAGCPLDFARTSQDFFRPGIQIEYETDGTVSFIGVAPDENIVLSYQGRDLFDMAAAQSFRLIASAETRDEHAFNDAGYLFPDQIVSLWEADSQYDRKGGELRPMWGQIGIGDVRHFTAIRKVEGAGQGLSIAVRRDGEKA